MAAQALLSFVNGRNENLISVADRGLAFGDGVFETLLLSKSKLPFLSFHLQRLELGLARLSIACDIVKVEQQVQQCLTAAAKHNIVDGVIKIIISRGQGRGYSPAADQAVTIIISVYPLTDFSQHQREGVTITVCKQGVSYQPSLLGVKHLNRLDNVLAALEVQNVESQNKNIVEGLMLDDCGNICEAISRNVFLMTNGKLQTPDLARGGVKGVMRQFICEQIAADLNLPVEEVEIDLPTLKSADEVFLCNSISGIWPVVTIDDTQFAIGAITKKIQVIANQLTTIN